MTNLKKIVNSTKETFVDIGLGFKKSFKNFINFFKVDKSFKSMNSKQKRHYIARKLKDGGINVGTVCFGLFTVAMLIWMVVYIFTTGSSTLTWEFITSDYTKESLTLYTGEKNYFEAGDLTFENTTNAEIFSEKWGVALENGVDNMQNNIVYVVHIEDGSPFNDFVNKDGEAVEISDNFYCNYLSVSKTGADFSQLNGSELTAEEMCQELEQSNYILGANFMTKGEGIKGSLLTTLMLIGFSLLFSLPLGIGAAIYLGVYAKNGPITKGIRTLIDVTSGIPSIIFGLAGAVIFIPFVNSISGLTGGNIFTGSLTMALMLLPTIVKTTEESINVIPKSLTQASLALGASRTQTTFKVVLPNAMPGILTSTLLSIGRIIGESAALVFAMGSMIGNTASLSSGYASLAVHIYVILGGEAPRYAAACAIAIIILIVVLVLSLLVKLISLRLNRFKGAQ